MYNLLFKKSTFKLKYFSFSSELLPLIALSQILPSKLHKSKSDIKISSGIFIFQLVLMFSLLAILL